MRNWPIQEKGIAKIYEPKGRLIMNNFAAAKQATLAGAGISMLGSWLFRDELSSKKITPLLEEYWGDPVTIWCYYSSRDYLPTRVRLLIDYLVNNIERMA
ncbi:LysR substrate-binding domain-containing protein [Vibrio mexicanus]|uniref:LysR substrate-binding domain-containing protein n=1 Tax=Vibrio mexicanus TaxID=1004326 RepID=UPI002351F233|nr:LysR substrate-binding domain-containing protein [Vibrio mexicanus]